MPNRLPFVIRKSKPQITHCNAANGMTYRMSEEWENLREGHERVKWARTQWQTKSGAGSTAKDAAESIGMPESTYLQYERAVGTSRSAELTQQNAIRFGRKFKVDWVWLLTGRGTPFPSPEQERIAARIATAPKDKRLLIERMLEAILGDDDENSKRSA